jgi:hypothetical protein
MAHIDFRDTDRGKPSKITNPQASSRRKDHIARQRIFAKAPTIRAFGLRHPEMDPANRSRTVFLQNHRICTVRHFCTRQDPQGVTFRHYTLERMPSCGPPGFERE